MMRCEGTSGPLRMTPLSLSSSTTCPHALGSTAGDELFWHASRQYWLRHALKPGITGLAQIRGYRGATERVEDLARRVRCDLEYLSNWSLWLDISIMFKTLRVVIHKNAY